MQSDALIVGSILSLRIAFAYSLVSLVALRTSHASVSLFMSVLDVFNPCYSMISASVDNQKPILSSVFGLKILYNRKWKKRKNQKSLLTML